MEKGTPVTRTGIRLIVSAVLGIAMNLGAGAQGSSAPPVTLPDGSKSQDGAKNQDGKWVLPDGTPTYHIKADKTVDWYSYSGFRRYHDAGGCMQCHGPDGEGSTYGTPLSKSLKAMPYNDFVDVVTRGRTNEGSVMPRFDGNKNVMCYIDDIYIYLKARSEGVLPRGRPSGRDEKPQAARDNDTACLGR
jgi:methanol metabolism-related c-type cytochrome